MLTGDAADPIRYEIDHVQEQDREIGFAAGHLPYEDLQDKVPYIAGDFTGWRYKRMLPLHEVCHRYDPNPRNFFEHAQDMKKIRRYADSIDDCNNVEKRWVEIYRMQEQLRYTY